MEPDEKPSADKFRPVGRGRPPPSVSDKKFLLKPKSITFIDEDAFEDVVTDNESYFTYRKKEPKSG